jgi:hypothetical protein
MARVKGKATALAYDADGIGTYTTIGQVLEVTPPPEAAEAIDVTHMDSANGYTETDPGWIAAGDCTATIQYAKAQLTTLYSQLAVEQWWKITYAGGSNDRWYGFLSEIRPMVEAAGIVTVALTIAVSGRVLSSAS